MTFHLCNTVVELGSVKISIQAEYSGGTPREYYSILKAIQAHMHSLGSFWNENQNKE